MRKKDNIDYLILSVARLISVHDLVSRLVEGYDITIRGTVHDVFIPEIESTRRQLEEEIIAKNLKSEQNENSTEAC